MKINCPFRFRVTNHPDAVFLCTPHRFWIYAEAETEVTNTISLATAKGIKINDRVGLLASNIPEYIFWILALTNIGAVSVCLNTRLTAKEICNQLNPIGIDFLVIESSFFDLSFEEFSVIFIEEKMTKILDLPPIIDLDRLHSVFFTSGTTGTPKAASLTLGNHYSSARAVIQHLGIEIINNIESIKKMRGWLICLPIFHLGGMSILWRCLWAGIPIFLHDRFNETEVIEAVVKNPIGWISLVPTMLFRILEHPLFEQSLSAWQSLNGILIGGAPMPEDLQIRCLNLKLPIVLTYGMTEAASQITTLLAEEFGFKNRSSGRAIPGIMLKILNPKTLAELNANDSGEIVIQGKSVFQGYLNHPPIGGWFHTGDIGYLDEDGYLFVLDRRDDVIICGGENIYPTEVESVLLKHPKIEEVCLVGIKDKEWGQIPVAVIKASQPIGLGEIQAFCQAHYLSRYKIPRKIQLVPTIAKTSSGKIIRSGQMIVSE